MLGCELWPCFPLLQVNSEGKASPLSLLQMACPSGFCALVRLPKLICGGRALPKTLLDVLADGTILKVGVGCSEDASKLLQDYGLVVKGCLDLRYLAMRQRYGSYEYWNSCSWGANILARVVDYWDSVMKPLKFFRRLEASEIHIEFVRKYSNFWENFSYLELVFLDETLIRCLYKLQAVNWWAPWAN